MRELTVIMQQVTLRYMTASCNPCRKTKYFANVSYLQGGGVDASKRKVASNNKNIAIREHITYNQDNYLNELKS